MKRCCQKKAAGKLMMEKLTLTTARSDRNALRELIAFAEFFLCPRHVCAATSVDLNQNER